MRNLRLSYIGFASALALGVNGCASTPPPARLVGVRPVHTAPPSPDSAASNIYQEAVSAIERRDYARALDLLQTARDRAPHDARVLNAFGVVYDKLGRFDLSGRYYAQAQAADPGSPIVAENRAYSDVLQGKAPPTALASQTAVTPVALPAREPPQAQAQAAHVSLTALPVRTIVPAKAPELKHLPSTVGLSIHTAPFVPKQPVAAALQVASIAAGPDPRTGPLQPQPALTQQLSPAVAPAAMAPVMKVSLTPAKPLAVARPPAPREAGAPAMTPVALKTAGPALVIPAQSTEAALAVRPMQMADATTLRRVSLPTFQLVAGPPLRDATPERSPTDRPKPPPVATARPIAVAKSPANPLAPPRKMAVAIQRPATPAAPISTERPLRAAIIPPSLAMAHAAPFRAPARPGAAFIGRALVIVDASGNARSANAMRLQLARRGWTVSGARPQTGTIRSQTTIRYPAAHAVVARALANSLRIPVRLERCARSCQGVSLILGKDSRTSRNFPTGSGFRRLSQ